MSENLGYLTRLAQTSVTNRKFRMLLFQTIIKAYQSGEKSLNDYLNIVNCLFLLDESKPVAKILNDLIKSNESVKMFLLSIILMKFKGS